MTSTSGWQVEACDVGPNEYELVLIPEPVTLSSYGIGYSSGQTG